MDNTEIRDKWALVTGASSGLGIDFADQLASRGMHLILVARRREPMEELAGRLRTHHGVQVEVLAADLSEPEAAPHLRKQVADLGREVAVLVNNAGFGKYGDFLDLDWEAQEGIIDVNIRALVHLTHLFAADMAKRGFGRILQVGSIAGFQPAPTYAVYAAAKSFVLSFSQAINHEMRPKGVTCTVLCPGVTKTAFFDVAGQDLNRFQRATLMESGKVVSIGLKAMFKGKSLVIPGLGNKSLMFLNRVLPRDLVTSIAARSMSSD